MKKLVLSIVFTCIAFLCNATGGPYPMSSNIQPDEDEAKVVVYSNPYYTGGSMDMVNIETNELIHIQSSSTYYNIWFYIIPNGTYRITAIQSGYSVEIQGSMRSVNDIISFNNSGYFIFHPNF